MNEINSLEKQLHERITNLIVPIQTEGVIDDTAYISLLSIVNDLSSVLLNKELIPKSVLNEIFVTIKILRNESLSLKKSPLLEEMANKLEYLFELILKGETSEQRVPGVPRII